MRKNDCNLCKADMNGHKMAVVTCYANTWQVKNSRLEVKDFL
jgi:hypothetical protein